MDISGEGTEVCRRGKIMEMVILVYCSTLYMHTVTAKSCSLPLTMKMYCALSAWKSMVSGILYSAEQVYIPLWRALTGSSISVWLKLMRPSASGVMNSVVLECALRLSALVQYQLIWGPSISVCATVTVHVRLNNSPSRVNPLGEIVGCSGGRSACGQINGRLWSS